MKFAQQDLHEVEGHEADADGDGPFDPVHAQALVEAADHALLRHDLTHGARDAAVGVSGDAGRLHASAHHVQRVRGRLTDQSCALHRTPDARTSTAESGPCALEQRCKPLFTFNTIKAILTAISEEIIPGIQLTKG